MILDKTIDIRIHGRNIDYFKEKGYKCQKGDIIPIKVHDLRKSSKDKIKCKCDECGSEKELSYSNYITNYEKNGRYVCYNCRIILSKETWEKKYGVDNPSKVKEIRKKTENTNKNRYGTNNPMKNKEVLNKNKETVKKKYGVDNVFQNTKIKNKIKKHYNEKYGVDFPQQAKEIRKTSQENNIKKYNVDHPFKLDSVRNKISKTIKERYGVDNVLELDEFRKTNERNQRWFESVKEKYPQYTFLGVNFDDKIFTIKCDVGKDHDFDINFVNFYNRNREDRQNIVCTICNKLELNTSSFEEEVSNFITNNTTKKVLRHQKIFKDGKRDVDIYIPDLNIAFETNGLYWHSEVYKENNFHYKKTEDSEKEGIQLIHIYQDDWNYKRDIVKSRILNLLGKTNRKIYARKCEIRTITNNKQTREFLDENHLQGFVGSKYKFGLYYDNELVTIMTFGKKRIFMNTKSVDNEYELLRFCNKKYTTVIGGANRLFKYFIKNYKPESIISYADRSWSVGKIYEKLGFKFHKKDGMGYHYIIDNVRVHRYNFTKDKLIKKGFDKKMTEHEIMLSQKCYRIYNSGNLVYIFNS